MLKAFLFGEKTTPSSSLPPSSAKPTPSPPEHSFALKHDVSIKIVVVGAPGVGKTTIARQYIGAQPRAAYVPTIGPEVLSKYVPLDTLQAHVEYKGKRPEGLAYDRVKVDLWEVPHQELYGHNVNRIVSGANGFVIVFDSSAPATFAAVNEWFTAIKAYKEGQGGLNSNNSNNSNSGPKCESPCVTPSPPLVPVGPSKDVMSTLEHGKACAFSVPTVLLAHKADVKAPAPECASLIGGLNAYCAEFGALFWAKTSSHNGAAALKRVLDMFVNSVFDNYLRREELRIVMAAERSKARRAKIRPVQIIHHEGGGDGSDSPGSSNSKSLQLQQQQQKVRKEVLERAERLQLDVSEYSKIGKEAIQGATASGALPGSEKQVMLGKFDEDITKLAAAVAALVKSAASAAAAPLTDLSVQKQCDDTGKAVERVRCVFGRKKAKWDDILSKHQS